MCRHTRYFRLKASLQSIVLLKFFNLKSAADVLRKKRCFSVRLTRASTLAVARACGSWAVRSASSETGIFSNATTKMFRRERGLFGASRKEMPCTSCNTTYFLCLPP